MGPEPDCRVEIADPEAEWTAFRVVDTWPAHKGSLAFGRPVALPTSRTKPWPFGGDYGFSSNGLVDLGFSPIVKPLP